MWFIENNLNYMEVNIEGIQTSNKTYPLTSLDYWCGLTKKYMSVILEVVGSF
jgi:hypothetical protein